MPGSRPQCKSVQPVPDWVEEPGSPVFNLLVVLSRRIHPFPRCPKPALKSRLSKLFSLLVVRIPPQAENSTNNKNLKSLQVESIDEFKHYLDLYTEGEGKEREERKGYYTELRRKIKNRVRLVFCEIDPGP